MTWQALQKLLNGMIGKTIVVLSLISPVSYLAKLGVNIDDYKILVSGALCVLISYVLMAVFVPAIITSHKDPNAYADYMMALDRGGCLDFVSEFKILEDRLKRLPAGYDGFGACHYEFTNLAESKDKLGPCICVRSLSVIKYELMNRHARTTRMAITCLFGIGLILFYSPLFVKICKLYSGG